jgi:hypothetical protein
MPSCLGFIIHMLSESPLYRHVVKQCMVWIQEDMYGWTENLLEREYEVLLHHYMDMIAQHHWKDQGTKSRKK